MKAAGRLGPALERATEPAANDVNQPDTEATPAPRPVAKPKAGYGKSARDDIDALVERSR